MIKTSFLSLFVSTLILFSPSASQAHEGTHSPCQGDQAQQASSQDVQNALDILKRECARKNNCTAEQELAAVEKILTGVAGTVAGDDPGFFAYLKEKISIGLRVLTGSYDVEDPHSLPRNRTGSSPIQPASHH